MMVSGLYKEMILIVTSAKMPRDFYVKTGNDLILNMYDLIKSEEDVWRIHF